MPAADWWDRFWCWLILAVLIGGGLALAFGCNAVGRDQVLAQVEQRLVNVENKVSVAGDMNDAWTARILAAGVGAALFYPLIWRPVAKRRRAKALALLVAEAVERKGNGKGR